MTSLYKGTGELIRKFRIEQNMTQSQLGEKCEPKINEANIRKYESGRQIPKLDTIKRIAKALGVPAYKLIVWKNIPFDISEDAQKASADAVSSIAEAAIESTKTTNGSMNVPISLVVV